MIDDKAPKSISEFANADTDPSVAMKAFRVGIERDLQICFPACVYSYDRYTHIAEVMPLVKAGYFTGKQYEFIRRKPISVTVRQICCGGITLDFPLFVGDTGWVISSDRDTSLLKQMDALTASALSRERLRKVLEDEYQQVPNQPLIHDFTQGFFIPDSWSRWEYWRYKDAPQIPISTGIYIGSSFDSYESKSENNPGSYQKGDEYENQTTSSLVINPGGSAVLACSRGENSGERSVLELSGKSANLNVTNTITGNRANLSLSEEDGIVFRSSTYGGAYSGGNDISRDALFKISRKEALFQLGLRGQHVSISVKDGNITLGFTGDLNLMCKGTANIQTGDNSNITIGGSSHVNIGGSSVVNVHSSSTVNCGEDATINAGDQVKVNAGGEVKILSGTSVSVGACDQVNIAAGHTMKIESGVNMKIVNRGGDIDVVSKRGHINVRTEGYDSPITVAAEKSDLNIMSGLNINMFAERTITMTARQVQLWGTNLTSIGQRASKTCINGSRMFWNDVRIFNKNGYLCEYADETTAQTRAREKREKEQDEELEKQMKKMIEEWEKAINDLKKEEEKEIKEQQQYERDKTLSGG